MLTNEEILDLAHDESWEELRNNHFQKLSEAPFLSFSKTKPMEPKPLYKGEEEVFLHFSDELSINPTFSFRKFETRYDKLFRVFYTGTWVPPYALKTCSTDQLILGILKSNLLHTIEETNPRLHFFAQYYHLRSDDWVRPIVEFENHVSDIMGKVIVKSLSQNLREKAGKLSQPSQTKAYEIMENALSQHGIEKIISNPWATLNVAYPGAGNTTGNYELLYRNFGRNILEVLKRTRDGTYIRIS